MAEMEQARAYRVIYAGSTPTARLELPAPPASVTLGELTNIRSHLAAAAGMDGDALMRAWLAEVRAARPSPPAPDRRARTSTLLWITLLVALAARSTRGRGA